MEVGKHTYGHLGIKIVWDRRAWCTKTKKTVSPTLRIGKFCSIGVGCVVYLGGNHRADWISTYPFHVQTIHGSTFSKFTNDDNHYPQTNGNVTIGNDVWIGEGVTIMSGVKIGDGAVVAANSHVTQNVKPYTIVGGNPAMFYYSRFNKETVTSLLKLKWWDFSDSIINEISPILCSGDYEKLLTTCKGYEG